MDVTITAHFQQLSHLDPHDCANVKLSASGDDIVWSDIYGTKIVLKCKQILQFQHIKKKDEKNINEVQISVH
jgi:hypothetical protein